MAQPGKIEIISDIHWLNTIQYFTAKLAVFWHISTKLNCLSCLAGLLSGRCSFLLPDVQTWICTVHTLAQKYHRITDVECIGRAQTIP